MDWFTRTQPTPDDEAGVHEANGFPGSHKSHGPAIKFDKLHPEAIGGCGVRHCATREVGRTWEIMMDLSSISTSELADRIALVRDNIRQITERAAAESGAADEERNAGLLARQTDELDALVAEQERRLKA